MQGGGICEDWQDDRLVDRCNDCGKRWGVLSRRHHCRACGVLVCAACSRKRLVMAAVHASKKQRVCETCHAILTSIEYGDTVTMI